MPNFVEVNVYDDKANNQYTIKLLNKDGKEFSSSVLSEGTLRLLTLCVFLYDDRYKGLLCYEEPENGIHPFRIKFLTELLYELCVDFSDIMQPLRQVLVNTHSPVLIGEINKLKEDKVISVWFSQLNTLLTEIDNKKVKISITKMLPVSKSLEKQASLFPKLSDAEQKLTVNQVENYLQTNAWENAL